MKEVIFSTKEFDEVYYTVHGSGEVIVLLHGFPMDGQLWNKVVSELSEKYCLIIPDFPGCGRSTYDSDDITVEDMALFVKQILLNEGVDKAIIAGHSMGGYATMAFAELYPEMLKGIGLIHSFATADSEEKKEQRIKSIELFRKGGSVPFVRQMIPALFAESTKKILNDEINELTERAILTKANNLEAFYKAMINRGDRTRIFNKVNVPVLWIIGREDGIANPRNLIQQTSLSNVNFVYVYNNCGHMSMIETPQKMCSDLISFADYCCESYN